MSRHVLDKHELRGTALADYHPLAGLEEQIERLRETAAQFYRRGWAVGTSGNFSVVVGREPLELLITASGRDKARLSYRDFVRVGPSGRPVAAGQPRPSAETLLHLGVATAVSAGAVLHTHSVWATVLSELYFGHGAVILEGYEMLKGLAGITTHQYSLSLEIVDNTQDIPRLARHVQQRLADPHRPLKYGFLIRRHGLYTWGRDLDEARRHVEILEFLLECRGRELSLANVRGAWRAGPS